MDKHMDQGQEWNDGRTAVVNEEKTELQKAFDARVETIASSPNVIGDPVEILLQNQGKIQYEGFADEVQFRWEREQTKSYRAELFRRTKESAVKQGVSEKIAEQSLGESALSLGTCFTREAVRIQKMQEGLETYVSDQDENWLSYLYLKKVLETKKPEKERTRQINENDALVESVEGIYNKLKRRKNTQKEQMEFIRHGIPYCECDSFGSNARITLELKRFGVKADASRKRHSLSWLGERPEQVGQFLPEDYWFYEQKTGINLSAEVAETLGECFKRCEKETNQKDKDLKNFILKLVCFCIEENYSYIACVPAINWKIHVMKFACAYIVEPLISEKPRQKQDNSLINTVRYLWELERRKNKRKTEEEKAEAEAATKLAYCMISAAFNQILNAFVEDALPYGGIFAGEDILGNIYDWIPEPTSERRVRGLLGCFVLKEPYCLQKIRWDKEVIEKWVEYFRKSIEHSYFYGELSTPLEANRNLLVFCDGSMSYSKELSKLISKKQKLERCAEKDKDELGRAGIPSRSEEAEWVVAIQTAIENAILKSSRKKENS